MFQKVGLYLAIIFLVIAYSERCFSEQRFLETPPSYQEVSSGEDVELRCKVSDKKGQCIWQKDRKAVGMHRDKYETAGEQHSDCTLLIRNASLEFDDGLWECQVTAGDFTTQDGLTSLPSRLLVRVKPKNPQLEHGGQFLSGALTLNEGQEDTISCVSRFGNPPAVIKWSIGGNEIKPLREQTNATEVGNSKTWAAHSLVRIRGRREHHGLSLKCHSLHPTNPQPTVADCRLYIKYSPEVRMETSPKVLPSALEDSSSFMSIKCSANANPPATIKWYKDGVPLPGYEIIEQPTHNSTYGNGSFTVSEVRFEPVKKDDAGLYSCKAFNVMGESQPANYRLDVKYGPRLIVNENTLNATVGETEAIAKLGSTSKPFICPEFEGNPSAQYRWIHMRGGKPEMIENPSRDKTDGRHLLIKNIVWSDEGDYRCIAYNMINGVSREMPSDARFILHVSGPPEIQPRPSTADKGFDESVGWIGEPVHRLKSRFCSRPPPRLVAWQWGSSHIRAGEHVNQKYEAMPLEPITENKVATNCYWAKLEIRDLQKEDARIYTLLIESEQGHDSTDIKLIVKDPTEMRVIAIGGAVGILLLFIVITVAIYSILRIRNRRYRKEEEEEGSIAADAFYTTPSPMERAPKTPTPSKTYMRKSHQDGGLAVMYDYDQMAKQSRTMSPEALKVRRAPVVLQAPTLV